MLLKREFHDLPLVDTNGRPFQYMMPDKAREHVHKMDQRLGGRITISERVANRATQDLYLVHSLIEEAITSSQLEGASTSRPVAKEMIRTGHPPRDRSERMILNNYQDVTSAPRFSVPSGNTQVSRVAICRSQEAHLSGSCLTSGM